MNYRLSFVCAFILVLSYQNYVIAETESTDSETLVSGINQFSADLYKALVKQNNGNFATSSITALTLLSILANGADGNSRDELIKAIHLPMTRENIKQNYRELIKNLNSATGIELHLANKIFVKNQIDMHQAFQSVSEDIFQSKVEKIDLENTNGAAEIINNWVKEVTASKIEDIVNNDDLSSAQIAIMDAAYFKGSWVNAFSSDLVNIDFHLSPSESVSAPMMCLQTDLNHGQILDSTALYVELPYKTQDDKNELSMYVVIPNEINGLNAVNERIGEVNFSQLNVSTHGVEMCMPKIGIKSKLNLIPTVKSLGVNDVFGSDANLSNLAACNNLKVSNIIQKAVLHVDETGIHAATAKANVHGSGHHHEAVHAAHHVHHVRADRPFMFTIVSKTAGIPLLWSQIVHPPTQSHK